MWAMRIKFMSLVLAARSVTNCTMLPASRVLCYYCLTGHICYNLIILIPSSFLLLLLLSYHHPFTNPHPSFLSLWFVYGFALHLIGFNHQHLHRDGCEVIYAIVHNGRVPTSVDMMILSPGGPWVLLAPLGGAAASGFQSMDWMFTGSLFHIPYSGKCQNHVTCTRQDLMTFSSSFTFYILLSLL